MKELILNFIAYVIIWSAVQVGRNDNPIKINSKDWWIACVLVLLGGILLKSS